LAENKVKRNPDPDWDLNINDLILSEKTIFPVQLLMKECTSFRSAPRQSSVDFFECHRAVDYIAALIALSFLHDPKNQIMIEPFLTKAARAAYFNNYEGKWIVVKEILTTRHFNLHNSLKTIPHYFSANEFYGNLIPQIIRMTKSIRFRIWHNRPVAPVKKPQRKRGYTDKGTSTPLHEKRLGKNDSVRLNQLYQKHLQALGPLGYYYQPRENSLLDKRIERNPNYQQLSSLYDELIKIQEEKENVEETERLLRARIKRVVRQLKTTTSRCRNEKEES